MQIENFQGFKSFVLAQRNAFLSSTLIHCTIICNWSRNVAQRTKQFDKKPLAFQQDDVTIVCNCSPKNMEGPILVKYIEQDNIHNRPHKVEDTLVYLSSSLLYLYFLFPLTIFFVICPLRGSIEYGHILDVFTSLYPCTNQDRLFL